MHGRKYNVIGIYTLSESRAWSDAVCYKQGGSNLNADQEGGSNLNADQRGFKGYRFLKT
jgi:hypothetical protein